MQSARRATAVVRMENLEVSLRGYKQKRMATKKHKRHKRKPRQKSEFRSFLFLSSFCAFCAFLWPFSSCSSQYLFHHFAVNIGEPVVAALEAERQFGVVEAQAVHERRLQVVNVNHVLRGLEAEFVALAVRVAGLDAAAAEDEREAIREEVATEHLAARGAAFAER